MKSEIERKRARALKSQGYSFKDISEVLGLTYDVVRDLCNYKKVAHPRKSWRRLKITKIDSVLVKRAIARFQNVGEKVTSPKIKEECKLNVSTKTAQTHLTKLRAKYKRSKHQIVLSR